MAIEGCCAGYFEHFSSDSCLGQDHLCQVTLAPEHTGIYILPSLNLFLALLFCPSQGTHCSFWLMSPRWWYQVFTLLRHSSVKGLCDLKSLWSRLQVSFDWV